MKTRQSTIKSQSGQSRYLTRSKGKADKIEAEQTKEEDTKINVAMVRETSPVRSKIPKTTKREYLVIDKDITIVRNILPKRKRTKRPTVVNADEYDKGRSDGGRHGDQKADTANEAPDEKPGEKQRGGHWNREKDGSITFRRNEPKKEPCKCCLGSHNKLLDLSFNLKTLRWSNQREPMNRARAYVRAKQLLNRIKTGNPNTWFKCLFCDRWGDDLIDILYGYDELRNHVEKHHRTTLKIYKKFTGKVVWADEMVLRRFQQILMDAHDDKYEYNPWRTSPMWRKIVEKINSDNTKGRKV